MDLTCSCTALLIHRLAHALLWIMRRSHIAHKAVLHRLVHALLLTALALASLVHCLGCCAAHAPLITVLALVLFMHRRASCVAHASSWLMRCLAECTGHGQAAPLCGVVLAPSLREVPVNWKRSRFTLIRGPHIDKYGMEQFEVRRFRAVVRASTNATAELQWLLEHLKLYEFTGVEMVVHITSSTYLTPPQQLRPTAAVEGADTSAGADAVTGEGWHGGGEGGGALAAHRASIARYLQPARALAAAESRARGGATAGDNAPADAELRAALSALRGGIATGLRARREALRGEHWFQEWHAARRPAALSTPAPTDPAHAARAGGQPLRTAALRDASALLSSLDAALLSVRFDALEAARHFPAHIATAAPGAPLGSAGGRSTDELSVAEWAHRVLKYAQYQARVTESSQHATLLRAYSSYTVFSHTLLYTLLKLWVQATVGSLKPHLALPSADEAREFMGRVKSRGSGSSGQRKLFATPRRDDAAA
eukprot:365195-Chlamydomonas_euryale.AAC.20